jgi:phosphopentomutase
VDTTTPSTDHSREYIPLLLCGAQIPPGTDLGICDTFGVVGATLADFLGVRHPGAGKSLLS